MDPDDDGDAELEKKDSSFLRFLVCKSFIRISLGILGHTLHLFLLAIHQPIYVNLPSMGPSIHHSIYYLSISLPPTYYQHIPASSIPAKADAK